ncbi:MAG: 5'-methylthioadenosine/S-adenosylhomocysteine nucleosidase [Kiritimatiellae bacterium]|nr:5'-methylthioadenosine/S-adenosylhomocysteine nucleosidase [Kiritimatiellia bacterium]
MKVFVIAMNNEAECVISNLENVVESELYGRRIVRGTLNGEDAFVVVSGVGKSNAAAATQLAIQETGAKMIYNLGVSGGLDPAMRVGDIYEVANAVQYDFDLVQINGTEMGTLNERDTPLIPCRAEGRFAAKTLGTGDRFNDSADDSALLKRLGASLRDMEGAAIAHVCETAGVELVSYKCISDVEGSGSMPEQYMENLKKCLSILTDFSKTLFMV